jgi:hypothetical protein
MRAFAIALWISMVAATGYALFHITFQVEALEGQLAELNAQIREERDTIHNLKAEWAFSTRLDWIETLGERHLPELERMSPAQALKIEDIPFRRPESDEAGETAAFGSEFGGEEVVPFQADGAVALPANYERTSR